MNCEDLMLNLVAYLCFLTKMYLLPELFYISQGSSVCSHHPEKYSLHSLRP